MTSLTEKVISYQQTGDGLGRLVAQISELVYKFPASQKGFTDEDGAEFLLRFLPRITRLIARYRETGQTFESYLAATLRWQIKTLAADRSGERVELTALRGSGSEIVQLAQSDSFTEMVVRERATEDTGRIGTPSRDRAVRGLTSGQGRRLVLLSLKMSEHLGESDYRRVAAAAGCDPDWLVNCWQALRDGCAAQRERRRAVTERRDHAWFKLRCLQYRSRLILDDEERERLGRRVSMWRRRHENALSTLRRMHCGPSHTQIAAVLGVPKGTVDSSVFYGKRELQDPDYIAILASAVTIP